MRSNRLFVANWKMNMPFDAACSFVKNNLHALEKLSKNQDIVLCPSFISLHRLCQYTKDSQVQIGAQNCSAFEKGAYTGEVSAVSLQQIGSRFCIVGHSERRYLFNETNEMVAQKVAQLFAHTITPIICIGETKKQYEKKETFDVLQNQLQSVQAIFLQYPEKQFIIAYEPVWAIGTGLVADTDYLHKIFAWLDGHIKKNHPQAQVRLLYGGSVKPENAPKIIQIEHINGFLIGGASLDFQKFQNIVLLNS